MKEYRKKAYVLYRVIYKLLFFFKIKKKYGQYKKNVIVYQMMKISLRIYIIFYIKFN